MDRGLQPTARPRRPGQAESVAARRNMLRPAPRTGIAGKIALVAGLSWRYSWTIWVKAAATP